MKINVLDNIFGKLLVIGIVETKANNGRVKKTATCVCECGNTVNAPYPKLTKGDIRSCGCYRHGKIKTKSYVSWYAMKTRCLNKNADNYGRYGKRGVKVCKGLMSFNVFDIIAGCPPTKNHTIDRITSSLNYSCGRCEECKRKKWGMNIKWSTPKEQASNRGDFIHNITFKNETHSLQEWADMLGIKRSTLNSRINTYEWGIEKALTTKTY